MGFTTAAGIPDGALTNTHQLFLEALDKEMGRLKESGVHNLRSSRSRVDRWAPQSQTKSLESCAKGWLDSVEKQSGRFGEKW